jgi:hypothetical protein
MNPLYMDTISFMPFGARAALSSLVELSFAARMLLLGQQGPPKLPSADLDNDNRR